MIHVQSASLKQHRLLYAWLKVLYTLNTKQNKRCCYIFFICTRCYMLCVCLPHQHGSSANHTNTKLHTLCNFKSPRWVECLASLWEFGWYLSVFPKNRIIHCPVQLLNRKSTTLWLVTYTFIHWAALLLVGM